MQYERSVRLFSAPDSSYAGHSHSCPTSIRISAIPYAIPTPPKTIYIMYALSAGAIRARHSGARAVQAAVRAWSTGDAASYRRHQVQRGRLSSDGPQTAASQSAHELF